MEVLLIEGHPVFDAVAVTGHNQTSVPFEAVDNIPAGKAVIVLFEVVGGIKVVHADHRSDAVGDQLIDDIVIKLQTFFIGFVVTVGDNTCPADRETVEVAAHLFQPADIFFIPVVKINADLPVGEAGIGWTDIIDRQTLAAFIPGALSLERGCRAAPVKILR